MRLPPFDYLEPKTLEEASKALVADPAGSVLLAGGTDLVVNIKHRLIAPKQIINLKTIPDLAYLTRGKNGLRIGALATLEDVASSDSVQEQYPALSDAARQAGAYAHQVMGTVGGNLCQGNRCRYYNQSISWRNAKTACYKAGGRMCWVVQKPEECYATYCGDLAPVFAALDARIAVIGPNGRRLFPLEELYTQDGNRPLSLQRGEILEEVVVPPSSGRTLYLKVRLRGSIDFPIISLAVSIHRAPDGIVTHSRVVFSGVGSGPVRAPEAERALMGTALTDELIDAVSRGAVKAITPLRTSLTSPAYKRRMSAILLKQALETLRDGTS